jgi:hypothetical protein
MPLFRNMTDDEKFRILSALDVKLTAIMETRVKLRDRRNSVILSSEEDFEIETQLLRLDQSAGDIVGYKDALASCNDDLQPPTATQLDDMRRRVQRIRDINVQNATASAIITTATEVIGEIPKKA